jgi:hypothetical protein
MITIKLGMISNLDFRVTVDGTTSPVTETRLSIAIDNKTKISYTGTLLQQVASFEIEGFDRFGKVGQKYPFFLEVFIGNQWFVPFTGELEFVNPVAVSASLQGDRVVAPLITVTEVEKSSEPKKKEKQFIQKSLPKPRSPRIMTLDEASNERRANR